MCKHGANILQFDIWMGNSARWYISVHFANIQMVQVKTMLHKYSTSLSCNRGRYATYQWHMQMKMAIIMQQLRALDKAWLQDNASHFPTYTTLAFLEAGVLAEGCGESFLFNTLTCHKMHERENRERNNAEQEGEHSGEGSCSRWAVMIFRTWFLWMHVLMLFRKLTSRLLT